MLPATFGPWARIDLGTDRSHWTVPLYALTAKMRFCPETNRRPFTHSGATPRLCRSTMCRGPGRPNHCSRTASVRSVSPLQALFSALA